MMNAMNDCNKGGRTKQASGNLGLIDDNKRSGYVTNDGSWATIWRYKPTPESSDPAGETCGLVVVEVARAAALVCEVWRDRFMPGACGLPRVLMSQAGRVTVAFIE
jgi:hypothetical protein